MNRPALNEPVEITTSRSFSQYGRVTATGEQVSVVCTTANRYMWVSNKKLIKISAKSLQKCGGG